MTATKLVLDLYEEQGFLFFSCPIRPKISFLGPQSSVLWPHLMAMAFSAPSRRDGIFGVTSETYLEI
jgi:hypothetical protein